MRKITTIVFLLKDDQVLLAMKKRSFGAGKWNGAGGKADTGETPLQAAVRECQEEIGVTPTHLKLVGILDFYDKADPEFNHYTHIYTTRSWQGKPIESEEMRPKWFATTHIPYDEMWAADHLWMPYVLNGDTFSGAITFNGDTIVSHDIKRVATLDA